MASAMMVGLLQIAGFDYNFESAQPRPPQSDGVLQKLYLWKKRLLALVDGSHFRLAPETGILTVCAYLWVN